MERTADPGIFIEDQRPGYVRYRHVDGRRWEVRGFCDHRGYCLVGAIVDGPTGPVQVRDLAHIEELKQALGRDRIDVPADQQEIDVPVGPGFKGCCPLEVMIL